MHVNYQFVLLNVQTNKFIIIWHSGSISDVLLWKMEQADRHLQYPDSYLGTFYLYILHIHNNMFCISLEFVENIKPGDRGSEKPIIFIRKFSFWEPQHYLNYLLDLLLQLSSLGTYFLINFICKIVSAVGLGSEGWWFES